MMVQLTDIDGVTVGHWTDAARRTGCTVVLCPAGATASVDVRGGAPGTRETDLLRPAMLVEQVHAVVLAGGSAFGLAAASGVMAWLAERGYGFDTQIARVPIVPAAVLFDLGVGDPTAFPDADAGYAACEAAGRDIQEGAVGAGSGATVGKILGPANAHAGGVGTATLMLPDGTLVGAIVAVNAWGHIIDPDTGTIVAGARAADGRFIDTVQALLHAPATHTQPPNTTIGVVVTNANLSKSDCARVAMMAHVGLARTIRPVHTPVDGDSIFVLARPASAAPANVMQVGVAAAATLETAILRAVQSPDLLLPSSGDAQR